MTDINRRHLFKSLAAAGAVTAVAACADNGKGQKQTALGGEQQGKSVMNLVMPKMDVVRVGFIGVGQRGAGHVRRMTAIDGIEITAICDIDETALDNSIATVNKNLGYAPERFAGRDDAYKKMLERSDIDIVIISTPWKWHVPMALATMESGKHAFVEVPAAFSVEDCWVLVNTSERTQMNCMMMENTCYGQEELTILNMVRLGMFGELTHGEGAYIHDLRRQMKDIDSGTGSWRTGWHAKIDGNLYPTHGLGPIAQYMNINRGDRFDYLTSVSSPALGRAAYAEREFPADHQRNQLDYITGDMNTSLIKTANGKSIMVQHDTTTPRPYNRINLIQGTKGAFTGYPARFAFEDGTVDENGNASYHKWDHDFDKLTTKYEHPLWARIGELAKTNGGHGGMDFVMFWRMIYCLRNGEPLDQNVYDAAAWSAVVPLSVASVSDRSNSQDFPDFTRGTWKTDKPLGIVS